MTNQLNKHLSCTCYKIIKWEFSIAPQYNTTTLALVFIVFLLISQVIYSFFHAPRNHDQRESLFWIHYYAR
jgi:hypothetical protein